MMGGLVNGRRGGRSPPLLMAALIVCVLLLGFNYWVSSSRNVELQAKLLELEERVRQASVEKEREQVGRSEMEEQLHRQTQQLALLENSHQRQQLSAQNMWKQERGNLLLNISSSTRTVQEMKNHMKSLLDDLSNVQKELQSCRSSMNTLNKKLTYDMTQCNTQILAQKEECDEKIAAAKQEVQRKYGKQTLLEAVQSTAVATQKEAQPKPKPDLLAGNGSDKSAGEQLNSEQAPDPNAEADEHLMTNEFPEEKTDLTLKNLKEEDVPPTSKVSSPNETLSNLANEEALEGVMDIKGGDLKAADALMDNKANKEVKVEDAIEYDNEGEIEKRLSDLKDDKAAAQEFDDELADYNGDDENEPEFEADKQAELSEA